MTEPFCKILVLRDYCAPVSRGSNFVAIETEHSSVAEVASVAVARRRAE
jgi:hypothetical protein